MSFSIPKKNSQEHSIVIGGGFAGIQTALELAKKKAGKVTLLEQGDTLCPNTSSSAAQPGRLNHLGGHYLSNFDVAAEILTSTFERIIYKEIDIPKHLIQVTHSLYLIHKNSNNIELILYNLKQLSELYTKLCKEHNCYPFGKPDEFVQIVDITQIKKVINTTDIYMAFKLPEELINIKKYIKYLTECVEKEKTITVITNAIAKSDVDGVVRYKKDNQFFTLQRSPTYICCGGHTFDIMKQVGSEIPDAIIRRKVTYRYPSESLPKEFREFLSHQALFLGYDNPDNPFGFSLTLYPGEESYACITTESHTQIVKSGSTYKDIPPITRRTFQSLENVLNIKIDLTKVEPFIGNVITGQRVNNEYQRNFDTCLAQLIEGQNSTSFFKAVNPGKIIHTQTNAKQAVKEMQEWHEAMEKQDVDFFKSISSPSLCSYNSTPSISSSCSSSSYANTMSPLQLTPTKPHKSSVLGKRTRDDGLPPECARTLFNEAIYNEDPDYTNQVKKPKLSESSEPLKFCWHRSPSRTGQIVAPKRELSTNSSNEFDRDGDIEMTDVDKNRYVP